MCLRLVSSLFLYSVCLKVNFTQSFVTLNEKVILEFNHEIQLYQSLSILEFLCIVEI